MAAETDTPMRVVVCDDDPLVRSVVTELVEQRSGRVIAETDRSSDAIALIDRFEPDVVVVDLALTHGSGTDIVEFLAYRSASTRIIVFTSFDGEVESHGTSMKVVRKPDFGLLERHLDDTADWASAEERRRPTRAVPPASERDDDGTDRTDEFYRLLAEAHADDTLLRLSLDGVADVDALTATVRRTMRTQDRLIRRGSALIALLIGGGEVAPGAVCARLQPVLPDIEERATSIPVGTDPIQSFMSLGDDP